MKRIIVGTIALLIVAVASFALVERKFPAGPTPSVVIDIDRHSSWEHVFEQAEGYVAQWVIATWKWHAGEEQPHPGRYVLRSQEPALGMYRRMALGYEDPLRVTIRGYQSRQQAINQIASYFPIDSIELKNAFDAHPEVWILPNTYHMYQSATARDIVERMQYEWEAFWSDQRLVQASRLGLTPQEVVVLSSIVQAESKMSDEQGRVAAVYLARLRDDWPLDADPTLVYAVLDLGLEEQPIRRVYNWMKRVDHPFNTYKYKGLPPSPLATVDAPVIDRVLGASAGEEMFFCADPQRPGYHLFATNYVQHRINSARYHRWLNRRGVR